LATAGNNRRYLFTSESVSMGHPDKVADQISDAILDSMLAQDKYSRVACETMVSTGMAVVAGEITTKAYVEIPEVVREVIREIGYTSGDMAFDCDSCAVLTSIKKQSPDIAMGVDKEGAGDQGLMFGYACRETEELMPLPIMLSHRLVERLSQVRRSGTLDYLRPDGKSQVSVRYRDGKPVAVETIVVSTQHADHVGQQQIREDIIKHVIQPVVPAALIDPNKILYHINPTGRFVTGGPMGDTGLTGRKIIVDTYGGSCPHGGGAFSGKDPTKVDRSGAYMARHVAKNIVAAGLADSAQVQVAYAIGVPEPVSIMVKTDGAGKLTDRQIEEIVRRQFDFRPRAIIEYLNLRRPIFRKTAAFGHFGRNDPDFTWETTNRVKDLRNAAGI
jgi:S-adenosylmethionine synthetase